MANSTTGPLWILDTTGTITTQQVRVRSWKWMGATTAGHQLIVKDGAGGIRFKSLDGHNTAKFWNPAVEIIINAALGRCRGRPGGA